MTIVVEYAFTDHLHWKTGEVVIPAGELSGLQVFPDDWDPDMAAMEFKPLTPGTLWTVMHYTEAEIEENPDLIPATYDIPTLARAMAERLARVRKNVDVTQGTFPEMIEQHRKAMIAYHDHLPNGTDHHLSSSK